MAPLQVLLFDRAEAGDGVTTLHALAAVAPDHQTTLQAAVQAEAQRVLDWAWQHFAHSHGPLDEGADWDHDLHTGTTADGWWELSLTISASDAFVAAFDQAWGDGDGDGDGDG